MMDFFLCTFVAYTFINAMKYYKQTLYILCGLLLTTVGLLVYLLYLSGVENQEKDKQTAEVLLKHVAGIWLKCESEKWEIPFYSVGAGTKKKKRTKRHLVLSEGEFTVEVDSLKDERSIFIPETSENSCIRTLFMIGEPSVEELNKLWQECLDNRLSGYNCGLKLVYKLPNGKEGCSRAFTGNLTFDSPIHKLGNYYLDDMYYIEVSAYLSTPSVWRCLGWGDMKVVLFMVVVVACIISIILIWIKNGKKLNGDEYLSLGDEAQSSSIVCCIADAEYQVGEILWNEKEKKITFRDISLHCSNQPGNLLSAFIRAEGFFLSNTQISEICNWNPDDIGVSVKRRSAMAQLRRLLMSDESHVNVKSGKNEMKENGYYLCIEK